MGGRLTFAAVAVAATLIGWGCASPTLKQCVVNSDCKAGNYCVANTCRYDCKVDIDCTSPAHCDTRVGKCVGGLPDGGTVPDGFQPPPDFFGTVVDLVPPPPDLVIPPPPPDLVIPPPPPDLLMPSADLTSTGGRPYGDVCSLNGDCKSTICSVNPFVSADHECTGDCPGCMLGDFCVGGLTCAQSDVGKSCVLSKNGADCRGGACLGVSTLPQTAFCTRLCVNATDCPAGYSCSQVQASRVCINIDATPACASDNDCWYGTKCDVAHQRCLGTCNSAADCPLYHQCLNNGGNLVCRPNLATGRGGIDAPCSSGNDCRQGACLLNRCLAACGVTLSDGQWCPGGYGCNPVGDGMGGYILGCLPGGLAPLGTSCVDNTSCASGLCDTVVGCTRFCNDAPCPSVAPNCIAAGIVADGVNLLYCSN